MSAYSIAKLLIKRKKTDGLAERLNQLYLYGQLTDEQYDELMGLLGVSTSTQEAVNV